MANKQEIMAALFTENTVHGFSEDEFKRFVDECAAEVNGAFPSEMAGMVKSATLSKKGISFTVEKVKLDKSKTTLRVVAFVAAMQVKALEVQTGFGVKADIQNIANKLRESWKRKDEAKVKESDPAAKPTESVPA